MRRYLNWTTPWVIWPLLHYPEKIIALVDHRTTKGLDRRAPDRMYILAVDDVAIDPG